MGDVCDVCEAPATFWRRHGEPVDRCDRHAPSAENILLDLIADLRDIYEDMGGGWELKEAADRAEERLREVGGHE